METLYTKLPGAYPDITMTFAWPKEQACQKNIHNNIGLKQKKLRHAMYDFNKIHAPQIAYDLKIKQMHVNDTEG